MFESPLKSRNVVDSEVLPTALPGYSDQQVLTCPFQRIVGSLLYLATWMRLDLSYTVVALAQHNASPTRASLLAAKGVLRYLKGTRHWGLTYGEAVQNDTIAFSDADWATNQDDHKSVSGYAFYMFSSLVSWLSSKQKATALSSTEAEYMAITHVSKEALWIQLCQSPIPLSLVFAFRQPKCN